jgi:hypothetical protein
MKVLHAEQPEAVKLNKKTPKKLVAAKIRGNSIVIVRKERTFETTGAGASRYSYPFTARES